MSAAEPGRESGQLDGVPPPECQTLLVGHVGVREGIGAALAADRLPGALLLHGPQGIGKATLAFAMAGKIFAQTGDEDAARVREQISAGSYPNLFVLRRQPKDTKGYYTVIRVEDIRALRERLRHTRGRAGYRVAIIDAIDDCSPSAANALLKTLEEPPPETLFFLVSHRPGQLLPTIKSRCQGFAMRPLPDEEVGTVLAANRRQIDPDALARVLELAEGRPRRGFEALALADDGTLAGLKAWLAAADENRGAAHLGLADKLAADPSGSEAMFARDMIYDWIAREAREAALAGASPSRRLASATELWDKAHALFEDADRFNLDARQTLITIFDAIRRHGARTAPLSEMN